MNAQQHVLNEVVAVIWIVDTPAHVRSHSAHQFSPGRLGDLLGGDHVIPSSWLGSWPRQHTPRRRCRPASRE
jgi:hypothetical protein